MSFRSLLSVLGFPIQPEEASLVEGSGLWVRRSEVHVPACSIARAYTNDLSSLGDKAGVFNSSYREVSSINMVLPIALCIATEPSVVYS